MARDQIFISYSHKDKDWLERLQTMLVPLTRAGFKIWADTDIKPGQEWKQVIKQALTHAKVAVLLVSPDFLASRFIYENELPPLLEAAKHKGLTILWVPVRPSLYEETVIGKYHAACDPQTPLSTLPVCKQEEALAKIARIIESTRPTEISPSKSKSPVQSTNTSTKQTLTLPIESKPLSEPVPPLYIESGLPAKPTLLMASSQFIHGWSAHQVQDLQRQAASALSLAIEFRDTLKDGTQGPLMVVIPGGRFLMGSPTDEPGRANDEHQHEVEVAPFAIGKYTVTFEEYDRFAEATRRDKPFDSRWGRGRRPVINISWHDAVAYAEWLSQQTSKTYRLPTEAEWEYACRAGTTTAYHFGTAVNTDLANYSGGGFFKSVVAAFGGNRTVEVGRYPANAWGLHDMHGNVWEWTCSVYDKNYGGGERRCAESETSGPCVLRGGSWLSGPLWLGGAARYRGHPHSWDENKGFRLARTFP